ncbi:hypothetical protein DERP_011490 [Dermatophagoides pteronyssinus]|uniref:Uncharacterized protein n=1 Tax=Dermatophagoides pteronyssinus TaxID=6956 RepID=A0ABQ8JC19_DERPT|nr:hypothetical protein DERP_011490 [Dermatophagoides pteronyssinus]
MAIGNCQCRLKISGYLRKEKQQRQRRRQIFIYYNEYIMETFRLFKFSSLNSKLDAADQCMYANPQLIIFNLKWDKNFRITNPNFNYEMKNQNKK